MKEIVWQEFNKSDRLVTKRKSFKSGEAIEVLDAHIKAGYGDHVPDWR